MKHFWCYKCDKRVFFVTLHNVLHMIDAVKSDETQSFWPLERYVKNSENVWTPDELSMTSPHLYDKNWAPKLFCDILEWSQALRADIESWSTQ